MKKCPHCKKSLVLKDKVQKFYDFMRRNKAWDDFEAEFYFKEYSDSLLQFLLFNEPEDYISGSFIWGDTERGCKFFNELDDKWMKELR